MDDFTTPPNHIHFVAKKLFGDCGKIIDGSIAYIEVGGGGPCDLHIHEYSHLFIVISGQAQIKMGDIHKILNPSESFLLDGKTPHSVWNIADKPTVMLGISVKPNETKRNDIECKSLDEVRENIDRIDKDLIRLISERSIYVNQAVNFKKTESDVEAPKRVEQIITKVRNLAKSENLDPDIAESVYRTMISAFIEQEKSKLKEE
ncbi:chorismate mutase [Dysgonomonas alginatilytica]|uniref:chorismate mutase n=1 Tax=Dysgonomonas alginatilytica TaxID=1605892 RepID=A0A2V3PR77_9BACT|nr:chorismate mutase [Dysgonomonas alginatilytica]PXV64474.1 chorismate mutase [Dysgonomonas alginatilytica]